MSHPIAGRSLGVAVMLVLATGCPTVDLGETPVSPGACRPDPGYFEEQIWPGFLAPADPERTCVGEAGCHRLEDGRSALRLTTDPLDLDRNYDVVTRFLDCGAPDSSSLYVKPVSGVGPHGGGDLFAPGDPTAEIFLGWFP